jgi:hypothetical protein
MRKITVRFTETSAVPTPYVVKFVPATKDEYSSVDAHVIVKTTATGGVPITAIKHLLWECHWQFFKNGPHSKSYSGEKEVINAVKALKITNLKSLSGKTFGKTTDVIQLKLNGFRIYSSLPEKEVLHLVEHALTAQIKVTQTEEDASIRRKQDALNYKSSPEGKAEDAEMRRLANEGRAEDKKKLEDKWGKDVVRRVTSRQIGGDDGCQHSVLIDGRVFVNGLTRSEVEYYKVQAYKIIIKGK